MVAGLESQARLHLSIPDSQSLSQYFCHVIEYDDNDNDDENDDDDDTYINGTQK